MFRKLCLAVIILASGCGGVWAADQDGIDVRFIGGTFKTLARGYVATVNMEKFKADKIARIERMRPEWFGKKYAEVYEVLRTLPADLRERYGLTTQMRQEQAVRTIRTLDKKKLYELIDQVPDRVIAEQFRLQIQRNDDQANVPLRDKIARVWQRAVTALSKGAPPGSKK